LTGAFGGSKRTRNSTAATAVNGDHSPRRPNKNKQHRRCILSSNRPRRLRPGGGRQTAILRRQRSIDVSNRRRHPIARPRSRSDGGLRLCRLGKWLSGIVSEGSRNGLGSPSSAVAVHALGLADHRAHRCGPQQVQTAILQSNQLEARVSPPRTPRAQR
jgi:hypothetical protein